ncbi:MAG TPA: alpha/beta fold hydrolase [Patescibacteria group bacterium]|nr:alpha/beta fold hydrolase [Patescibacteria group bacterium]
MDEKRKKKVKGLLFEIAFLYFGLLAFLYFYQRHMMYVPNVSRPEPAAYGCSDMAVVNVTTADGLTLYGWYKAPAKPDKPLLLMFHGNAGNIGTRNYKARFWLDHGYGVLMAEYRGYGGNAGNPTEQGLYQDGRAFLKWLFAQGFVPSQIVLKGESLGTGVATQMATENPNVRALVLESPFRSTSSVAKRRYFFVPVELLMKDRYENLSKIKTIKAPLLIVHGLLDTVVPYEEGKALFDAANEPKKLATIPDAGHNDLYMHGAGSEILEFLEGLKAN